MKISQNVMKPGSYLQLLLLFDPLLLSVGDEDEDWPRPIFIILHAFSCGLLSSCALREEPTSQCETK